MSIMSTARQRRLVALAVTWWFCLTSGPNLQAQSGANFEPTVRALRGAATSPAPAVANPFSPPARAAREPPLACGGFCPVTLLLDRRWGHGDAELALDYMGRRYRFADLRKRAIFAAAPHQYAPLLNGNCLVAQLDDGEQMAGKTSWGLVYRNRIVFLSGPEQLRTFRESPDRYFNAAIAAEQVALDAPAMPPLARVARSAAQTEQRNAPILALSGYCPVTLLTIGRWERGGEAFAVEIHGLTFRCRGVAEQTELLAHAERYLAPSGGYCPVAYVVKRRLEPGHAEYVAEYPETEGKLYVFSSAAAKQEFLRDPQAYLDPQIDWGETSKNRSGDATAKRTAAGPAGSAGRPFLIPPDTRR